MLQDALGMDEAFRPKFVRRFAHLQQVIIDALGGYVAAVKDKTFPNETEAY